jgi:hypothetical protein
MAEDGGLCVSNNDTVRMIAYRAFESASVISRLVGLDPCEQRATAALFAWRPDNRLRCRSVEPIPGHGAPLYRRERNRSLSHRRLGRAAAGDVQPCALFQALASSFAAGQRKSKRFNRREFTQVALISDRHITIVLQAANEITGPADLGREPFDNMVSTGGRASAPSRSESDPLADFVPIVGHRSFVSKIAKHRMGAICA